MTGPQLVLVGGDLLLVAVPAVELRFDALGVGVEHRAHPTDSTDPVERLMAFVGRTP
ncbi:hypothetical protein [Enemella dayhoffiae]|uniref:hypothetical protein n=1 Tax=Enemella dayhoffiae TaxID=2016507 RepID=UPI0015957C19|nr:hypothetical protein [Enemella dayhoffiae]